MNPVRESYRVEYKIYCQNNLNDKWKCFCKFYNAEIARAKLDALKSNRPDKTYLLTRNQEYETVVGT